MNISMHHRWLGIVFAVGIALLVLALPALAGSIGPAFLIKDINTRADATGSAFAALTNFNPRTSPPPIVVFNGTTFFAADDGITGHELWKYDGTTVTRVADIYPGAADSNPDWLTVFSGTLYFSAEPMKTLSSRR